MFIYSAMRISLTDSYTDAGRVLTDIGYGAITATVPSYIAELSIPSIRGILTGFFECAYQIGSVIGFWINFGITETCLPSLRQVGEFPWEYNSFQR